MCIFLHCWMFVLSEWGEGLKTSLNCKTVKNSFVQSSLCSFIALQYLTYMLGFLCRNVHKKPFHTMLLPVLVVLLSFPCAFIYFLIYLSFFPFIFSFLINSYIYFSSMSSIPFSVVFSVSVW